MGFSDTKCLAGCPQARASYNLDKFKAFNRSKYYFFHVGMTFLLPVEIREPASRELLDIVTAINTALREGTMLTTTQFKVENAQIFAEGLPETVEIRLPKQIESALGIPRDT